MADHDFPADEVYAVLFEHDGSTFPKEWPSEIQKLRLGVTMYAHSASSGKSFRPMTGAALNALRASLQDSLDAAHEKLARDGFAGHVVTAVSQSEQCAAMLRALLDGTHVEKLRAAKDYDELEDLQKLTRIFR